MPVHCIAVGVDKIPAILPLCCEWMRVEIIQSLLFQSLDMHCAMSSRSTKNKAKSSRSKKVTTGENVRKENISAKATQVATTPSTPKKQSIRIGPQTASATKQPSDLLLGSNKDSSEATTIAPANLFSILPSVKKVYKLVQKSTGALGGNGYDGAIYGELTMHSMQKVLNFMTEHCEMDSDSLFIDVGSGLGKPNFHAAQDPGVRVSVGIELEEIRWQLAMQNLKTVLGGVAASRAGPNDDEDSSLLHGVNFMQGDIFDVITTDPFTHIYMYDLGFPPPLQQKIAEYFNTSTHARYLVSYRPPRRVIHEYGYDVEPIGKLSTSMTGSGENHTAYFYKRLSSPAPVTARKGAALLTLPARSNRRGEAVPPMVVVCSDRFRRCVELACGALESCQVYVDGVCDDMINAERPKRERKPRKMFEAVR